jgi:hypothetical protein
MKLPLKPLGLGDFSLGTWLTTSSISSLEKGID